AAIVGRPPSDLPAPAAPCPRRRKPGRRRPGTPAGARPLLLFRTAPARARVGHPPSPAGPRLPAPRPPGSAVAYPEERAAGRGARAPPRDRPLTKRAVHGW